jgi:hypothetical protein
MRRSARSAPMKRPPFGGNGRSCGTGVAPLGRFAGRAARAGTASLTLVNGRIRFAHAGWISRCRSSTAPSRRASCGAVAVVERSKTSTPHAQKVERVVANDERSENVGHERKADQAVGRRRAKARGSAGANEVRPAIHEPRSGEAVPARAAIPARVAIPAGGGHFNGALRAERRVRSAHADRRIRSAHAEWPASLGLAAPVDERSERSCRGERSETRHSRGAKRRGRSRGGGHSRRRRPMGAAVPAEGGQCHVRRRNAPS